MQQLNRPVAQTVAMIIGFTLMGPALAGTRIDAVPGTRDGKPVTVFSAPDRAPNKEVVVFEPFDGKDVEYNGVHISYENNHAIIGDETFRGVNVADIAGCLVSFLVAPE